MLYSSGHQPYHGTPAQHNDPQMMWQGGQPGPRASPRHAHAAPVVPNAPMPQASRIYATIRNGTNRNIESR